MATKELGNVKISLSDSIYTSISNQLSNAAPVVIPPVNQNRVIVLYGNQYFSKKELVDYVNGVNWSIDTSLIEPEINYTLGHLDYQDSGSGFVFQGDLALATGLEGLSEDNIDFNHLIDINQDKVNVNISFGDLFNIPFTNGGTVEYKGVLGLVFLNTLNELSLMLSFYPFNEYENTFRVKGSLILGE